MFDLLQYSFIQNALAAAILASIACGIIGVYVVVKKIVFISGGIAHASFGGIGLGYYLGINPMLGVLPFSLVSALIMGTVSKKSKIPEDSAIGILWSLGMALGVIFVYLTPGYAPDLMTYLFGNILTVPRFDLYLMLGVDIVIVGAVYLFYKEFLSLCFDEEFTTVQGFPTEKLYLFLLCIIALTIVVLIKVVGIILVIALLTIPATLSRRFTHNLKQMMLISIVFGTVISIAGIGLSYALDVPSGATIILVLSLVYGLVAFGMGILENRRISGDLRES
ncbi:metal ABC transporter permease [Methanosarcina sp. Z-7115]|uniref:Metal ABC transporter permease n=1 Tax=Methanosarcina baikalica TaxID=3073890 RepID=A0ABU2D3Y3_9EURY|nr:metal ABC transporter permease [Methanosarcina sp. Z-7115]MDR7666689.1 metal ABC transporter permease [Methanosarcina sp. Z-7115]